MLSLDETIIARATPHGCGGRGILRLSGDDSVRVLAGIFHPDDAEPRDERKPVVRTGTLTPWEPERGVPCDLYFWPSGRGYTGQRAVELHLWGCEPILDAVQHRILRSKQGRVRLAQPGEFTLRAFLAGRLDLTQAEAVLGVIDAVDFQNLQVALDQLAGGIGLPLHRVQGELLDTLSHLEAGFDFVDEEIDFISRPELLRRLADAEEELAELLRKISSRSQAGQTAAVLLIGPPNAGKSSLYNILTENRRGAIVSPIPGTTRDYLETPLVWDGISFRLVDSAGVDSWDADSPQNTPDDAAQTFSRKILETASLVLHCVPVEENEQTMFFAQKSTIRVGTKCDLVSEIDVKEQIDFFPKVETSSVSRAGIEKLKRKIVETLRDVLGSPEVVPATAVRCRDSIEKAWDHLQSAHSLAEQDRDEILVASELRAALDQLGQVLGTIHTDDILDRVFSRFCIGK